MKKIVRNLMNAALMECCSPHMVDLIVNDARFDRVSQCCEDDLLAFARKDPAAQGRASDIAFGYGSYKAVLHYRMAHMLLDKIMTEGDPRRELASAAMLVSSRGKFVSGAEIHARCKIGQRFVLDHGYGTVIGETTEIGDDCYVLGGVVLGATGISGNPEGKRHPTIGNRVEIGAFARVFGNVIIGDDVFIAPHCVIKNDIAADSIVTLRTELQVTQRRSMAASRGTAATRPTLKSMEILR
ncbi:Serine acetyltransferase [Paraburkholderia ribeironis]|uniref:serine O-acetyltransferase n=1 Tax=Paraburkholderia ribeironis TaxID=1247936 RepID=A0A1N7S938_9BURK|nr:serine O-acetyltransferase [Paraburkholderia ribeironis]SIT43843.1 Serine acetyltransferase [Paraburkholderia ribeironis]